MSQVSCPIRRRGIIGHPASLLHVCGTWNVPNTVLSQGMKSWARPSLFSQNHFLRFTARGGGPTGHSGFKFTSCLHRLGMGDPGARSEASQRTQALAGPSGSWAPGLGYDSTPSHQSGCCISLCSPWCCSAPGKLAVLPCLIEEEFN